LLGIYFLSIVGVTDYFLVTIGKLRQYVLFGLFALALDVGFDFLFLSRGYGIEGVALGGTLIAYACYSTVIIGYALSHYTRQPRAWLKYFGRLFAPFAYMLILVIMLERLIVFPGQIGPVWTALTLAIQVTLFGVGSVLLVYLANRELRFGHSVFRIGRLKTIMWHA
jgi:hypothetical protein